MGKRPYGPAWKDLKVDVLYRDNYRCAYCESDKNLITHHINYPGNSLGDAITLCRQCHAREHANWIRSDMSKARSGYVSVWFSADETELLHRLRLVAFFLGKSLSGLIKEILAGWSYALEPTRKYGKKRHTQAETRHTPEHLDTAEI